MTNGGTAAAPITVRARDPKNTILDPGRSKRDGLAGGLDPMDGDWAMFKLFHVRYVRLIDLNFANCWPQAIYLRGVSDLVVRGSRITGSRFAIYARTSPRVSTRRLLIEGVDWVQDPDHEMWKGDASWKEVKEQAALDKSWFNGALFGSYNIPGDVLIRGCDVSHAFNGVRMDMDERRVGTGAKPRINRNRNVRIIGNRFSFIRDNAIEPEVGARGWLVADNQFAENHAVLSLDGVALREFNFIGNRILNRFRPGWIAKEKKIKNSGGKIIKFLDDADYRKDQTAIRPARRFVTAFNSVRTRTRYLQDAALKPWTDANNAVERIDPAAPHDDRALFSDVIWRRIAPFAALATDGDDYAKGQSGPDRGDHPRMKRVFGKVKAPAKPKAAAPLGGWDGKLTLTKAAAAAPATAVKLHGPDGLAASIKGGGAVGYRSLAKLGLKAWAAPKWAAPSGGV
ncbi:MAG: hypothetical protein AAFU55_05390 [Pseudomonadota bacterium]